MDLWLSMMWQSRKAADLLVDDRILVQHRHSTRIDDPDLRLRYHDAVQSLGWRPVEPCFHLFVVDIADVTAVRYAKPRRV